MNVSSSLYTVSIPMYEIQNQPIKICTRIWKSYWNLEIFIQRWKYCRNLRWNLEILHNLSGNPEILHEILYEILEMSFQKSGNLQQNPKISKSLTELFQWSTPFRVLISCRGSLESSFLSRILSRTALRFSPKLRGKFRDGNPVFEAILEVVSCLDSHLRPSWTYYVTGKGLKASVKTETISSDYTQLKLT